MAAASARDILALLRPRQWPKNLLVLAALLFSGAFTDPIRVGKACLALLAFVLLSGAVYCFNDVHDADSDRRHPDKKRRPVASGRISPAAALGLSLGLAATGLVLAFFLDKRFLASGLAYLLLSASYTLLLKHLVILDVFGVAAGFVLRAAAGAYAIDVVISRWLMVCTTLLALFLVLSKRRAELFLLKAGASGHRRALDEYSPALLDQMISIVASATLVAYALYTAGSSRGPMMMLTLPYVLYGIFRYLYLSHQKGPVVGAPEVVLLTDRATQINLVLWIITAGSILKLER